MIEGNGYGAARRRMEERLQLLVLERDKLREKLARLDKEEEELRVGLGKLDQMAELAKGLEVWLKKGEGKGRPGVAQGGKRMPREEVRGKVDEALDGEWRTPEELVILTEATLTAVKATLAEMRAEGKAEWNKKAGGWRRRENG